MRRVFAGLFVFLVFLCSFAGTAIAAEIAEPGLADLIKPVLDAVKAGQWPAAAALALVLLVALAKRYGAKRWPWLNTDVGGSLLTLLASFGGASATALLAGAGLSLGLLWSALGVAFAAAGGYSMLKRLAVPVLRKLRERLPAWARPVLDLLLWIFPESPVAKAEAAGAAAVAANPAPGLEGIVGKPKDFP